MNTPRAPIGVFSAIVHTIVREWCEFRLLIVHDTRRDRVITRSPVELISLQRSHLFTNFISDFSVQINLCYDWCCSWRTVLAHLPDSLDTLVRLFSISWQNFSRGSLMSMEQETDGRADVTSKHCWIMMYSLTYQGNPGNENIIVCLQIRGILSKLL